MTGAWKNLCRVLPLLAAAVLVSPDGLAQQKGPPADKGPPAAKGPPSAQDPSDKTPPGRDKGEPGHDKADQARDGGPALPEQAADAGKREQARDRVNDAERNKARKHAKEVIEGRKDLPKARRDARTAEKERIKDHAKKSGKAVPKAALKNELERHARRMARLARLSEVADKAQDTEAMDRIDKLTVHELARHDKWMDGHATEPTGGAK
jgi:hypothetical protein